ncbi:ribosome maturation factor RimM [Fusobacterium sp.]|uniref:ribosome maturation factor RimM n=1 Tax=Fusobacterium sp. TaxID=68766 RepID=UPI00396C4572
MELLTIGKISGTHHLKGAVKITFNIDNPSVLAGEKIIVAIDENDMRILTVKSVSPLVGNRWVAEFEEITNKTEAGNLKNGFIKIRREILGLDEDEYLLTDLVGMNVIDVKTGENIGKVKEIFDTAAHDILVVDSPEAEAMIPNIQEFVKNIDFEKREIHVELIEGLRELKGKKYSQDDGMDEE